MSPERTRWLLVGSALAICSIWINALWLQGQPAIVAGFGAPASVLQQPKSNGPRGVASDVPEVAQVNLGHVSAPVAAPNANELVAGMVDTVPQAEPGPPASEIVSGLRLELLRLGYGPITRSADVGLQMRAAILAFEYDQHLPLTAEPSDALLALASGNAPAARLGAHDARRVVTASAERTIQGVQTMLTSLGFPPGPADGRLSEATTAAIRAFEADQGLRATGRISALVMTRLVAATGARAAAQR